MILYQMYKLLYRHDFVNDIHNVKYNFGRWRIPSYENACVFSSWDNF
jgi:hypothetical protein